MADETNDVPDADALAAAASEPTSRKQPYSSKIKTTRGQQSIEYGYAGKLPPAEQMTLWAQYLPNAPERFLSLTEREQTLVHADERDHHERQMRELENQRYEMETYRYEIERAYNARTLGTIIGFLITVVFGSISVYMIHEKQGLAALAPLIIAIATLAGAFITGKQQEARVKASRQKADVSPSESDAPDAKSNRKRLR